MTILKVPQASFKQFNHDMHGHGSIFEPTMPSLFNLFICTRFFCLLNVQSVDVNLSQRFLAQTGGHNGGWDDYDHQLFLKLKSKHKVRLLSLAWSTGYLSQGLVTTLIKCCLSTTMYLWRSSQGFRFQTFSQLLENYVLCLIIWNNTLKYGCKRSLHIIWNFPRSEQDHGTFSALLQLSQGVLWECAL